MKKIKLFPLLLLLLFVMCACAPTSDDPNNQDAGKDIEMIQVAAPYALASSEAGKAVILNSEGVPQIMLSALLRTDLLQSADFLKPSETEDYFAIAAQTGMTTMDIVITWREVEPSKDSYVFDGVDSYLAFAKKYNMKLNVVWYGSFVDGETHTANIPSYVADDTDTYPVIADLFDYAYYGRCRIMDWSNANLLAREQKALYNLMNHVADWNANNDNYNPVVTVQTGQGVDRLQRWRVEAYEITENGDKMTSDRAWSLAQSYVNAMGKGVKFSKYKALTRVEFCEQNAVVNYVRDIEKLEYVDIVCPTYLHEISSTKNGIKSFADEYEDMPVINAENWASDINYKQILATFGMGASGYVSYQLSCPNFFPEPPNGALYGRYNADGATLAEKFEQIGNRADTTKAINDALTKAYVAVANAPRKNFATLGLNNLLNSKQGEERIQKLYFANGILLTFDNPDDSVGFAVYDSNYLYVYVSTDATLTIDNCTVVVAQKGSFGSDGEWTSQGNVTLADNKTLSAQAGEVYRVRFGEISSLPSASELKANGYLSLLDSIRG